MKSTLRSLIPICGLLTRIYWMAAGNALLAFFLIHLAKYRPPFPSSWDGLYAAIVVSLIGVRYLDIRFLGGEDALGEPCSPKTWSRYARRTLWIASALWLLVRAPALFR